MLAPLGPQAADSEVRPGPLPEFGTGGCLDPGRTAGALSPSIECGKRTSSLLDLHRGVDLGADP